MHKVLFDVVSNDSSSSQTSSRSIATESQTITSQWNRRRSGQALLQFSIDEVEAANTEHKPWVAIRGKVYDLTGFVNKHPGGKDFLLAAVGRDATAMYESMHSEKNTRVLNKYLIGTLKGPTNTPEYRQESPFYEEVKRRVDTFFKAKGKNPRDAPRMMITYLVLATIFLALYLPMYWQPSSWSLVLIPWIAAVVSGWSCAMMGFYPNHDGCHASFSNSPAMWHAMRRVYEAFTGLNTLLWVYQHGLGHHPYTNVAGADPDIHVEDPSVIRIHSGQPWLGRFRWQKYYWLPLYSQLVLSRKLTEAKNVFYDRQFKHIKINPPQMSEYFWFTLVFSIYALHHYVVPYFVLGVPLLRLMALHTISDLVWSVYLSLIFQASHVNNEVAWPDPSNAKNGNWKESDWAAMQIEASLDFAHGDFWTTFMCGSLNYQAVHHLFPHVSQWYYPEMAPVIMQCCKEFGVKYNLKDSIWDMIGAHAERITLFGDEELVLR